MPTEKAIESGAFAPLVSLGGIKDDTSRGRELVQGYETATVAGILISPDNPRRIALVLTNKGTNPVEIFLGATSYFGTTLDHGGVFQIDKDFPWTGRVSALAPSGDSEVNWFEVSLP